MDKQKLIERLREYGRQFQTPQLVEDMFTAAELIEKDLIVSDPIPPTIKPGDKVVYSEKPRYGIGEVVRLTALVDFRNFECACDISDLEISHD